LPLRRPCRAKTPGAGQVVAVAGMNLSTLKGVLVKPLVKGFAVVVSVQVAGCGGEVRLTSFWSRHV
jgi:hypothetical protein